MILFGIFILFLGLTPEISGQNVTAGDLGLITGLPWTTIDGWTPYYTFNGIPYKKPETYSGENRFKMGELWEGPLAPDGEAFLAINPFIYCPQKGLFSDGVKSRGDLRRLFKYPLVQDSLKKAGLDYDDLDLERATMGQEDCLVLNVNTPQIPEEGEELNFPVIVFIHGGGSQTIWGSVWNGMRLLTEKVILVSINYRLGIMGSLNLGLDDAPGNLAIYDAIHSLEWIQKYIRYFGGDPNRVIVTGQSAGAMMCGHLLASPLAAGKFHGVIGSSGSALVVWGTAKPNFREAQLRVAELAGCNQTDYSQVITCLRGVHTDELIRAALLESAEQENQGKGLEFEHRSPSVQSPELSIPLVLPKHPLEIMRAGEQNNVSVIFGATRHDGSAYVGNVYYNYVMYHNLLGNETFMKEDLIPVAMRMMGVNVDPVIAHSFARTFLGDAINSGDWFEKLPGFIDMASVLGMREGGMHTVELQSKINPNSYSYSFDHKGMFTELVYGILFGDADIPGGIAHTEDMLYLFQFFPFLDDKDLGVAHRMVKYWTNFAYYGNPNGNETAEDYEEIWPKHNEEQAFLSIRAVADEPGTRFRDHWFNISHELINHGWLHHFNQVRKEHGIPPIPIPNPN